jgi:hypothetical protein
VDVPVAYPVGFDDDEVTVDIAGIPGCGTSTIWRDVVDAVAKGTRARRDPGEGS